jgi:hypothetical protein
MTVVSGAVMNRRTPPGPVLRRSGFERDGDAMLSLDRMSREGVGGDIGEQARGGDRTGGEHPVDTGQPPEGRISCRSWAVDFSHRSECLSGT